MLTLTSEYQTALESDYFKPCYLLDLPGPLRLTTADQDLTWGGNTYTSSGLVMKLDGIQSSTDLNANTYKITLDNANTTALALYALINYVGADAYIYLGLLNEDGSLIVNGSDEGPFEVYAGIFDSWSVSEGKGQSVLDVRLKSHWAAYNRKAGRFTNSASQEEHYAGDTFFEHAHREQNEIRWGKKYK